MRSISILAAMAVVCLIPLEAGAAEFPEFPEYDGEGFRALYAYAISNTLPDLEPPGDRQPVTGDQDVDDRI